MGPFLIRRVAHMIGVLIAVLIIVSVLLRLIPGDPIDVIMAGNPGITEEDKQALRDQLGAQRSAARLYRQLRRRSGGGRLRRVASVPAPPFAH